jgi:hypothetical protein
MSLDIRATLLNTALFFLYVVFSERFGFCITWLLGAKRTDIGPYEFAVSGAGEDYIDLFNTYLFVEAHIVNTDGSSLNPDTDVGPVDLWMHSLFSDVSVSLSEKFVSPPTSMSLCVKYFHILVFNVLLKRSTILALVSSL